MHISQAQEPKEHLARFKHQKIARKGKWDCLICHRNRERTRYQKNPDHYRMKAAERTARYRAEVPHKLQARAAINHQIRVGNIERPPCEVCQEPKAQAHHPDYMKPLDVQWLCPLHHTEVHVNLMKVKAKEAV